SGGGSCFAGIFCLLRERSDFAGKLQSEHDERFEPIGFDDQKVMVAEPVIEAAESVTACLHFNPTIDAQERNGYVTTKAAAGGATKRHALRSKAGILKRVYDRTLDAIAFLAMTRTAHGQRPSRRARFASSIRRSPSSAARFVRSASPSTRY